MNNSAQSKFTAFLEDYQVFLQQLGPRQLSRAEIRYLKAQQRAIFKDYLLMTLPQTPSPRPFLPTHTATL